MRDGNKKTSISVSVPADLMEIIDELGSWQNRSALVTMSLEQYIRLKEPTMWKLLEMRREARRDA